MIQAWYPASVSTAESRLRYYAERFDTVEADSPYYGIPAVSTTERWAQRTPVGFVFHVKAYGLMTGHTVDQRSLAPELRGLEYRLSSRGRVYEPSRDMLDATFEAFKCAVVPLREAGKLGGILMQYPPTFRATDGAELAAGLARIAADRERLASDTMLVEFRHASWVDDARREKVLRFLADEGITFVCVDSPSVPGAAVMPRTTAVTAHVAYVRFHGRNAATWKLRSDSASDRFDYLYTPDELAEWADPLRDIASDADTTFAMFNNCRYDYAPRNARELATILDDAALPETDGLSGGEGDEGVPPDRAGDAQGRQGILDFDDA